MAQTIAQQLEIKDFPFEIKDKNGDRIYYEDSAQYWCKSKYDSDGNEIYFEDSDGYWFKQEYNSDGCQVYYENSHGHILDNRPKSCEGKIVEIDGKKYQLKELK